MGSIGLRRVSDRRVLARGLMPRGAVGDPMLYFGTGKRRTGGGTIAEALRRAWSRLIRKQWLVLYPLVLALINAAAFFAVYSAHFSGRSSSAKMAETGQTGTQAPQSMHSTGSI